MRPDGDAVAEIRSGRKFGRKHMRRILRENGLGIVWFGLFMITLIFGQVTTGQKEYNHEQEDHGQPTVSIVQYLGTSHFLEATMENWESEFLQMFLFVALTACFYQKGSSESKKLEEEEEEDRDPESFRNKPDAPWPVRRGGFILSLYKYSLGYVFALLFVVCFVLHAMGGAGDYNEEQQAHGKSAQVSTFEYMGTSRFWFESFQNWQSEFLSVASMVVFSIYLRYKGSPESKPVDAAHSETGRG
jgi:hypothetical protein